MQIDLGNHRAHTEDNPTRSLLAEQCPQFVSLTWKPPTLSWQQLTPSERRCERMEPSSLSDTCGHKNLELALRHHGSLPARKKRLAIPKRTHWTEAAVWDTGGLEKISSSICHWSVTLGLFFSPAHTLYAAKALTAFAQPAARNISRAPCPGIGYSGPPMVMVTLQ